jgi:hypothetical protein
MLVAGIKPPPSLKIMSINVPVVIGSKIESSKLNSDPLTTCMLEGSKVLTCAEVTPGGRPLLLFSITKLSLQG